jgi:hypothetical protein
VEPSGANWNLPPPQSVMICVLLLFLFVDAMTFKAMIAVQPLGVDWSPLWAGWRVGSADPSSLYDFARITAAQEPLIGRVSGCRPFVYPPSALLVFAPFAFAPIALSYAAWVLATGALYVAAARKIGAQWWLLLLMPPVFFAALVGQTSLLLGGMILLGLHFLEKRPQLAGIILGVATAIKPQLMLLLPLALLLSKSWRAMFFWAASGAIMVLAATALLGTTVWLDWIAALGRFQAFFEGSDSLVRNAITPYAAAQRLGIASPAVIATVAVPALAGIWWTFGRGSCVARRLIALVGGALLISPYAMNYELALLAPAIAAGAGKDLRRVSLLLVVGLSASFGFGLAGLAAAMFSLAAGPPVPKPERPVALAV